MKTIIPVHDDTPEVHKFANTLEQACAATVEAGHMTKDLATLTGCSAWLTTRQFLAKVKEALDRSL